MSVQENISMLRNIYDSYNRKDFNAAVKNVDSGAVFTDVPANRTFKGPDGFKQLLQNWNTAFPDSKIEIKNISAGEDFAVCEFRGTGTHKGTLRTPDGDIEATGKHADVPFCDVYRLKNGKIVSSSSYYDVATFMKQLGILEHRMHA
ncbi:MAG TPA: ester cyclase [Ignavibacteriales bacterium]|nr:ester cyclase [Ignavibacteriales bacterium]